MFRSCRWRCTRKHEVFSVSRMREICLSGCVSIVGRALGTPNKTTRALKDAIIYAAENSVHSEDKTLESYLLFLANDKVELFVPLLGRLLPLQINAKTERRVKVTYSSVEEVRAALIARGLAPERADLLLIGKV